MARRPHPITFAAAAVAAVLTLACTQGAGGARGPGQAGTFDVIIRGGRIIDGTGNPWFRGDIGITGDRITGVGQLAEATAAREIDATGLVVAPGFIDLHTHSDSPLLEDGTAQSKVRQGVTLDLLGEGGSVAPRDGLVDEGQGTEESWTTFTGYYDRLRQSGIAVNVASYVAASQVRRVVMGYDTQPASPEQLEEMKRLVARSMEEGAIGLVTRFESGGPEHPDEIVELAKVVASYGGVYVSHVGSEGFQQEREIDFVIRVAEEARIPAHIYHFKIRARDNWGTIGRYIDQVERARARGLDVTANQYPYTAMFHGWSAFFPIWAREGGPEEFARRLQDPAVRERIRQDPDFITWAKEHGWWEGIVMARARTEQNRKYEGMTLAQIARQRGDPDPAVTCITLMAEEGGNISGIFHTMSEDDVRQVMRLPWVAIASDGSAINLEAPGVPHPRNYSTNVRVLGHYVRDEGVLTPEDAVRKMTSLPAQLLGLRDRGQLREGFIADVVVYDPAAVAETNSFEQPKSYAKGVPFVLVNGLVVIDHGEHTGARPGRPVLGPGYNPQTAGAGNRLRALQ
ncbi:MAG: D-aminoacylase [Gemmatimonadetes bacterium]|nr:D-aminoacylase [Gemmatimonadota bacterium]